MTSSHVDRGIVLAPGMFSAARWNRWAGAVLALPIWLQALTVFVASRLLSLLLFAAVVRFQQPSPWTTGARTTLLDFLGFWDAEWYRRIAVEGYPSVLPMSEDGRVLQNHWAFYPLHPVLVDAGAVLTGLDHRILSPVLSLVCGAGAAILILHLLGRHASRGTALFALALVLTFPASAVLSTGYAESLMLLLLAGALLLVVQRRYLLAIPVVVLLDLSRPIGVAFSFFMLLHLIDRIRRRHDDPHPAGEAVRAWTLGVLSCIAALLHPAHAWLRTGSPTAYLETEAAWSGGQSRLLIQWLHRAEHLVGPFGAVLLIAVIAGMLVLIFGPTGARMGRTLQLFCLAYGVYLLLFFNPQTSTLRLLLPLFPMALSIAGPRSWTHRISLLLAFCVLQLIWIAWLWHFTPPSDLPP